MPAEPGKRQRIPPVALIGQIKKEPNELKRKMLLVGYLSDELSKRGAFLLLVGGQAVETYTAGQFTTGDIDIITTDQEATEGLLTQLGFKREGMIWLNEKLAIAVRIVSSYPNEDGEGSQGGGRTLQSKGRLSRGADNRQAKGREVLEERSRRRAGPGPLQRVQETHRPRLPQEKSQREEGRRYPPRR